MEGVFHGFDVGFMENPNHEEQQQIVNHQVGLDNPISNYMQSPNMLGLWSVNSFADLEPKFALNQNKPCEGEENAMDPVYFLKFPVLNDSKLHENDHTFSLTGDKHGDEVKFLGENNTLTEGKGKRKRTRTMKTSEEVESQRMTHITVERNRRKQMNEHLRALRSLMPSSYVQRGDQASIIGGAIEFVRELEQLLQCLESQKRRRLYPEGDSSSSLMLPISVKPNDSTYEHEESAESKSCLADIEVKVMGFDALVKILSRRRPGQLIRTIAALEELQLNVLHANITTVEQTVLYSLNIKIGGEMRFTAADMANSVQQIVGLINASMI